MSNESFSVEDLLPVAEQMLDLAKRAGTTSADVVVGRSTEFEVKVADQKIDTLTQATSKGLGLRVFLEVLVNLFVQLGGRISELRWHR